MKARPAKSPRANAPQANARPAARPAETRPAGTRPAEARPATEIATTVAEPRGGPAIGGALAIVGALMAIVGTLLPWKLVNATTAAGDPAGPSRGVEFDDGKIFIFVAVLTIVASLCFLAARRLPAGLVAPVGRLLGNGAALSVLTGGYVVCFGLLNFRDVSADVDRFNNAVPGIASIGLGIYLDLAAGVVMLAGAAIGLLARRR